MDAVGSKEGLHTSQTVSEPVLTVIDQSRPAGGGFELIAERDEDASGEQMGDDAQ